ncbi:hypothetical protein E3N88_04735 [Mikania micrantha]|uniref:Retrotransposon gag domain-containing protein n=1 Tax=Mikania micrantha TaxID=192012 RepID=A0A5N6PWP0_9ASTR|nr:hypothetical protein E3N88_04735 [Mikania micrantha]
MPPKRRGRKPKTVQTGENAGNNDPPHIETPLSTEDVIRIVVDQLKTTFPNRQTGTNGSGSHQGPILVEGGTTRETSHKGCSYKSFVSCKPKYFHGCEGAIGILKWIEKMESVISISDCLDNQKVKYATCSFQNKALTWWNTQVQARGREAVEAMTWEPPNDWS